MAIAHDNGIPQDVSSAPGAVTTTSRPGFCVWLTGLSGSGKSTTAVRLRELLEREARTVTLLDGDAVRDTLSPGLGFTREERDVHVRRIGFIAAEIVRHGGILLCAVISPYRSTRDEVRQMIGPDRFVEVLVDTPLEVCERRDPKGLYGRARKGEISNFTGVDDPYEAPEDPDVVLDTVAHDADENAYRLLEFLRERGLLPRYAAWQARGEVAVEPGESQRSGSPRQSVEAGPPRGYPRIYTLDAASPASGDITASRAGMTSRPTALDLATRPSLVPDLPPTRVYLVRHGTTLLNRQQRYRGRIDVPLDSGGWQDAWSASAELADAGIDAIYSSPLRRARDTGRVIADAAGIASVHDFPGLVNLDYGDWEGLTPDDAATRDPDAYYRYQAFTDDAECPGGERLLQAGERTLLSLHLLNLLHPGGTVVAVSHAVIVRLAIALVMGGPRAGWRRNLPNGSITRFDVGPETIELVAMPKPAEAAVD